MRIKEIENRPYIALSVDEAYQIKELLYSFSNSFDIVGSDDQEEAAKIADKLDEEILKAEAM